MANTVTVSVRRELSPASQGDGVAWIDQGLSLARRHHGCLGVGVIRDAENENVLHMTYRFSDEQSLTDWEHSRERQKWLRSGDPLVLDATVQSRTGIEGWFDGPELRHSVDVQTGAVRTIGVRSAPLRWKQAVAIWVGMFPLNLLVSLAVSQLGWWDELAIPLRSVLTVTLLVPIMTFFMMPLVTRVLRPWLRRNPGTIKSERALLEALNSRTPLG
ncbi:MAG: antibiotic biosynthesis monooxygenase [Actinobacteria bacterium]|nr:antibiotic biosynthesis monooxygenase [Actinomycetota bacterium]